MQKSTRVLLYILSGAVIASAVGLSSCSKDDDKPEAKPQLSFAETEVTVNEDEGSVDIEFVLDKAASEDITITYELSGSAQDIETASTETDAPDYGIEDDYLEIEIPKGETSATIHLTVFTDFAIEDSETINIAIDDVDSDNVEISRDDEVEITLEQEINGMFVVLEWAVADAVDMDLLLRVANIGQDVTTRNVTWGSAAERTTPAAEAIFIPLSIKNAVFGLSYTYFSGAKEPLNFTATFIDVVEGENEPEDQRTVYEGQYELDNINAWNQSTINTTKVVQTFEIVDSEFKNFTDITEPATSSRIRTPDDSTPTTFRKGTTLSPQKLQSILQRKHL